MTKKIDTVAVLADALQRSRTTEDGRTLSLAELQQRDRARAERRHAAAAAAQEARAMHERVGRQLSMNPTGAVAAINAVLELHRPMENRWTKEPVCSICVTGGATGEEPALWPCETFDVIAKTLTV